MGRCLREGIYFFSRGWIFLDDALLPRIYFSELRACSCPKSPDGGRNSSWGIAVIHCRRGNGQRDGHILNRRSLFGLLLRTTGERKERRDGCRCHRLL